jgi:pimeloyl-ACP methyl ester carboxylesterase
MSWIRDANRAPPPRVAPVVFGRCAGWLHDLGGGPVGAVLCSPWGFEEICTRRAWVMLADACSRSSIPALRFDYPGAGDSLGAPSDIANVDQLVESALEAAALLVRKTGVTKLVFIGQGIGALVATRAAAKAGAEGIVLLAPVCKGRDYLRELALWGRTVAESIGIKPPEATHSVAGFDLPEQLCESIAAVNLLDLDAPPAAKALVVARPGRAGDLRLVERLRQLGVDTETASYDNYEASLGNPTAARPPVSVIQSIPSWIGAQWPEPRSGERTTPGAHLADAILHGDGFVEHMLRVEGDSVIHGVLCEPLKRAGGATVLMVNAGGNPHTGWARVSVDHARALAAGGTPSLRMDVSDVGDSAGPLTDAPVILHAEKQVQDVLMMVNWLEDRGLGPVLTVGSCSGAYLAFNAALQSRSMQDLVLVNQQRFLWVRDGAVEVAIEVVDHYRRNIRKPAKLLHRALAGEIDWLAAGGKLARSGLKVLSDIWEGHHRRIAQAAANGFRQLAGMNVRVSVIQTSVTRDHPILDHPQRRAWFGRAGFEFLYVPDADHAVTPPHARQAVLDVVRERALNPPTSAFGSSAVAPDRMASKRKELSRWLGVGRGPEAAR